MTSRIPEGIGKVNKVKGSLGNHSNHVLPSVIGKDLIHFGKLPLCLFICVIITAIIVIVTAHHTRLLTSQCEQLILEHNLLDTEWRNLILEKNALGNHIRIEWIAIEKLQLQHIDPSQENIIVKK